MFQARFEGIVEKAFESQMCQVWTFSEDDAALNTLAVKVSGDIFNVFEGPHKGTIFNTSHLRNDFTQKKSVKKAHSYWKLEGNGQTVNVEHHENWNTSRISVQAFPEDESFSLDPKGGESVFFSRSRETLMRNQSKKCEFVYGAELLTSEYCSEIQALIAAQLLSKCR